MFAKVLRWLLSILALLGAVAIGWLPLTLHPPVYLSLVPAAGALLFAILVNPLSRMKGRRLVMTLAVLAIASGAVVGWVVYQRALWGMKQQAEANAAVREGNTLDGIADMMELPEAYVNWGGKPGGRIGDLTIADNHRAKYKQYLPLALERAGKIARRNGVPVNDCFYNALMLLQARMAIDEGSATDINIYNKELDRLLVTSDGKEDHRVPVPSQAWVALVAGIWAGAELQGDDVPDGMKRLDWIRRAGRDTDASLQGVGNPTMSPFIIQIWDPKCTAGIPDPDAAFNVAAPAAPAAK